MDGFFYHRQNVERKISIFFIRPKVSAHEPIFTDFLSAIKIGPCALDIKEKLIQESLLLLTQWFIFCGPFSALISTEIRK